MHHPARSAPRPVASLPASALPEHARPVSDLIERVLRQCPQTRVEVVIRLVRATLAHPAWERLPAEEAAARAERLVLAQLARLPSQRQDGESSAAAVDAGERSVDVTDARRPATR